MKWEQTFDSTIEKYKKEFGKDASLAGLAIIKENENLKWEETKNLFKDFIKKRVSLENKNKTFVNLHKSYASNEIRKNDLVN